MRETITTVLKGLPQRNPLERLRIGGLLAHWNRNEYALAFLESVPALVRELAPNTNHPLAPTPEASSDTSFLWGLNLFTGVDPDKVLELCWKYPELRGMALDPNIGKPSIENQRKILSFKDDPEPEHRAAALRHLAGWYAEWDKMATAHWDENVPVWVDGQKGAFVIDNEAELWAYWIKKIGTPIKP